MDPKRSLFPIERCSVEGCRGKPTGRKPVCGDHLDRLPYVQQVRAELDARALEARRVADGEKVSLDLSPSSLGQEIVDRLTAIGPMNLARLAVELALDHETTVAYVDELEERGLVVLQILGSRRGTPRSVVDLADRVMSKAS